MGGEREKRAMDLQTIQQRFWTGGENFESVFCPQEGIIPKAHRLPGNAAIA